MEASRDDSLPLPWSDPYGSRLRSLARLAEQAGAAEVAAEGRALDERLGEGRFYVACLGQFKRGKSTLVNALIGESILPTGVVPVTSAITVVRYAAHRRARVRLADGGWQDIEPGAIARYVTELENPDNEKRVAGVEVFVPSDMLASGMCLVDTPGLGSVFAATGAATRAFVSHIDAALVVLGADPPISAEELAVVEEVARHVRHLVFVLNKADRLPDSERREAARFTASVLARALGRAPGPILEVSATERAAASGPPRDWERLRHGLEDLAGRWGIDLLQAAEARGRASLCERLLRDLDEQRRALEAPINDSEARIERLRRFVAEAERSLGDLGYLLTSEQDRLAERFARDRERFLAGALPPASRELRAAIAAEFAQAGRACRRRAVQLAQQVSRRWLDDWLRGERAEAEQAYREASKRFVEIANDFLGRLAASGGPAVDVLPDALEGETGFRTQSRLFFTELLDLAPQRPLRRLLDHLRPPEHSRRAIERDGMRYLETLLHANSTRVQNDLDERVLESRRRLEAEIRSRLGEVSLSAERALDRARRTQAAGMRAVRDELARLEAQRRQVEALRPTRAEEATQ